MSKLKGFFLRSMALAVGAGAIGAMTHLNVTASGGYASDRAPVMVAGAALIVTLSLIVGHCWHARRRVLALVIGFALLGLEAHNAWTLIERNLTAREITQRSAEAELEAAAAVAARVATAERALAAIGDTSPRLASALAAKAAADAAAIEKAAAKGCAANCRDLLQQQVELAAGEIEAARSEIAQRRGAAEAEVRAAREAAATPRATIATGKALANNTGLPPWIADAAGSLLGSIPVALAAIAALVFAGHGSHAPVPVSPHVRTPPVVEVQPPARDDAIDHAGDFYASTLERRPRGRVAVADVERAYLTWCSARGVAPLPPHIIGAQLARIFEADGIRGTVDKAGVQRLVGLALKGPALLPVPRSAA